MKTSMYFNYPTRSLVRGGQRTLLAIFCVAVGVMAIVSLQLVGLMINNAFTSNVRDANGGDIAVRSQNQPFNGNDLQYFDTLKKDGTISNYTPVLNAEGSNGKQTLSRQSFSLRVVDPAQYPLVTPPTFIRPPNGQLANLLKNDQVVVTKPLADQYKKKVGDSFDIHISTRSLNSSTIHAKIVGIVGESGILAQAGSVVLLSNKDYQAALGKTPITYDAVDVTASSSQINAAVKKIQNQFPVATTQTATDALKQQQSTIDNIQKFLSIAGLLALLIGGVGIMNTMQVLLSRRKTEIAMLKTTGYRRYDLYLLFGLEAGLLGLIGGLVGTLAATGVSYIVRDIVVQSFGLNIPYQLDWFTLSGGILIGLVTALIFGLLPIVQGANIRPLNVIRELPEGRGALSVFLTILLLVLLSVLFCILSIVILNGDIVLGISTVYGTFVLLGLLSIFFGLLIVLISKLPVPERPSLGYLGLVVALLVISVACYLLLPAFGILLFIMALLGLVLIFIPRTLKASTKMALRNLGRQRARTTTTMLALFVGIFTIGLILVLGQNLHDQVNQVIARSLNFNAFVITSGKDTTTLHTKVHTIPGLNTYQTHTLASSVPLIINGQPLQMILPPSSSGNAAGPGNPGRNVGNSAGGALSRQAVLYFLSGIEGYDVGHHQLPDMSAFMEITKGRNLTATDDGTNNVVVSASLEQKPLNLKPGDKITLLGSDRVSHQTVTIVGFYRTTGFGSNLYPMLGTNTITKELSASGINESVFYLKIDASKLNKAVDFIGAAVPNAFVLNLANISDFIDQLLNDILLTLTTIASLSLLAGVIIIANAVALAMLERRRELGILKSVGYTSSTILGEVLLENGIVGGTGAFVSMLTVALVTSILGTYVFKADFSVGIYITLGLIVGSALLAMLASALVAWGAVRVRPLEVLRYE